ncbi:MAG TPA: class I SAM-dependent methyltransferase [Candidatus Eisenbacteria bacterium]|nr:class I SAM-dependent methyltransferase [Candidatus Eisenbacteria bacterium]
MNRVSACGCGGAVEPTGVRIVAPMGRYTLVRCASCGRKMLDPIPSDADLAASYDRQYYGEGESKFIGPIEAFVDYFRGSRARDAVRLASGIARAPGEPTRVLDIGCGSGQFLARLLPLGFEAHGTEYSAESGRRAAGVKGLRLHFGTLRPDTYPAGHFDIISVWHVLEHLRDPDEALRYCRAWLRPGGFLMLAVPNVGSWQARLFGGSWFHLDPPRHLLHFDPASLGRALDSAGFRLSRVRHLSWEQNLYGYEQSALNSLGFPRDQLYELLKGNRPAAPALSLALQAAIAGVLMLPAAIATSLEAAFGQGGTIECVAVLRDR